MLLRGPESSWLNHYSDDVVNAFVKKASEHGGVFRIFDALNDVQKSHNLQSMRWLAKKNRMYRDVLFIPYLVHTNETFVTLANS